MQDFHKIKAWTKAHELAITIRQVVAAFPKTEYRTLRNQMIRAVESIADNIAEGAGCATNAEFARYLDIAIKSTSELENQLDRAHAYGLLSERDWRLYGDAVREIRMMTYGLRKKVRGST